MIGRRRVYEHRNRITIWFNPTSRREIFLSVKKNWKNSFYQVPYHISTELQAILGHGHHSSLAYEEIMGQLYKCVQQPSGTPYAKLAALLNHAGPISDYDLQRLCQKHSHNWERFFHRKSWIFFGYWAAVCEAKAPKATLPCHRARMTWNRSNIDRTWLPGEIVFHGDTSCIVHYLK